MSSTSTLSGVAGMTCEHCVSAVTAELEALDGVDGVAVDIVPGGTSAVTVTAEVDAEVVVVIGGLPGGVLRIASSRPGVAERVLRSG